MDIFEKCANILDTKPGKCYNVQGLVLRSMNVVESLQLNGVAALHMTMPYYYWQYMLVITVSLVRGNWNYETLWLKVTIFSLGAALHYNLFQIV